MVNVQVKDIFIWLVNLKIILLQILLTEDNNIVLYKKVEALVNFLMWLFYILSLFFYDDYVGNKEKYCHDFWENGNEKIDWYLI